MSDDLDFERGDEVKLKGSRTKMVVHDVDPAHPDAAREGAVLCRWFNDSGDLQEARFFPEELVG